MLRNREVAVSIDLHTGYLEKFPAFLQPLQANVAIVPPIMPHPLTSALFPMWTAHITLLVWCRTVMGTAKWTARTTRGYTEWVQQIVANNRARTSTSSKMTLTLVLRRSALPRGTRIKDLR